MPDATINTLRERACRGMGIACPRVTAGSQRAMRTILRTERFIELVREGHRYVGLIRWRLAEKVYSRPGYFLHRAWPGSASRDGSEASVSEEYRQLIRNRNDGNYPLGGIPEVDENGMAGLNCMVDAGYIVVASERRFNAECDCL